MLPAALDGVRVLDLTHHIAGPFCTMLLAGYGASVIKIERPPDGDPARQMPPFFNDEPHPDGGALFLQLNAGKRGIVLDLRNTEGRAILRRLAERADIVVENFRPGVMAKLGLGYDELRALNPRAVLVSISNFGQTGPYRDLKGSEIVAMAMGGPMIQTGHRTREPLKLGGNFAQYHAGAVAAYAAMLALFRAEDEADGEGDWVDVSLYETMMASRDRRVIALTTYAYTGFTSRRAETALRAGAGVRPTADGYIEFAGYGARLPGLLRLIGRDDLLSDPRVRDPRAHTDPAFVEELEASYLAWSVSRTSAEALAEGQALGLIGGAINTVAALFTDPHFVERAPWDVIDHPHTGPLRYPGRPFIMAESQRPAPSPAPHLGEHTASVLHELGYRPEALAQLAEQGVIGMQNRE